MLGALFGFQGRLSRPGFWEVLMSIVLIDVALVIGRMYVADGGLPGGYGPSSQLSQTVMGAIPWVLVIFTLWGGLAAAVKRCHDRARSGLLLLLVLIPVIGWLWLLVDLFLLGGTEGRNRYGRAPHAPQGADAPRRQAFDWDAQASAPAAPELAGPVYHMLDPEPAHAAPQAEAAAPLAIHEPPPEVHAEEVVVHEEVHAQPEPAPLAVVEEAAPAHEPPPPEPMPELAHAQAPAPEPYDPLTAPLVMRL